MIPIWMLVTCALTSAVAILAGGLWAHDRGLVRLGIVFEFLLILGSLTWLA